jgi:shikimate kinase
MLRFTNFLEEGVNDPSIFKAVFLAGGPGSGKSFMVGKTALTSFGMKLINSDPAFEKQLAKAGLKTTPDDIFTDKGQAARSRATALTLKQMELAVNGRLGLVIDGTGKDFNKISGQVDKLKQLGYDVAMIFVNTDLETAINRDQKRARTLGAKQVTSMWKDVQKNIGKFQNLFGNMMVIVDNSDGSNYEGGAMTAYKKMKAWASKKPNSSVAKRWISSQRGGKK